MPGFDNTASFMFAVQGDDVVSVNMDVQVIIGTSVFRRMVVVVVVAFVATLIIVFVRHGSQESDESGDLD